MCAIPPYWTQTKALDLPIIQYTAREVRSAYCSWPSLKNAGAEAGVTVFENPSEAMELAGLLRGQIEPTELEELPGMRET